MMALACTLEYGDMETAVLSSSYCVIQYLRVTHLCTGILFAGLYRELYEVPYMYVLLY
jgi:hypothetical protein